MRHQRRELLQALRRRRLRVDLADLGEQPRRRGRLADGFVTAMNLQRLLRIDRGQSVGFAEFPAINEAVVARGTLHVDAEERLRNALRELNFHRLPRADIPTPLDAINEAATLIIRRRDQLRTNWSKGLFSINAR
jgi:hypothetical protein